MDFFLFMLCTSFPFRDENKKRGAATHPFDT
jgi:hypothetical protein